MIVAINYSDYKFKNAQKYNTYTAYTKGRADRVIEYSPRDIEESFYIENKHILENSKGAGYWLWKPYFIYKTLEKLNDGDYLFYCDSGSYYINKIEHLVRCMEKNKQEIMAFELPLIEKQWTKRDAFVLLNCDTKKYIETNQRMGGYILIKQSAETKLIIKEYLNYAKDNRIISDQENSLGLDNYEGFISHRHDQSIWSLLTKKHQIIAHREPTQYGTSVLYAYLKTAFKMTTTYAEYRIKKYYHSDYPTILISYRTDKCYKIINRFIHKFKMDIRKRIE